MIYSVTPSILNSEEGGMILQWTLIRLRKEQKLSQKDMAVILGTDVSTYGKKERGQLQFTIDEMFKLKFVFKCTMDEIFLPRNLGNPEVS